MNTTKAGLPLAFASSAVVPDGIKIEGAGSAGDEQ